MNIRSLTNRLFKKEEKKTDTLFIKEYIAKKDKRTVKGVITLLDNDVYVEIADTNDSSTTHGFTKRYINAAYNQFVKDQIEELKTRGFEVRVIKAKIIDHLTEEQIKSIRTRFFNSQL
jgi:hypothetical protein